jgi:hypothetical protein
VAEDGSVRRALRRPSVRRLILLLLIGILLARSPGMGGLKRMLEEGAFDFLAFYTAGTLLKEGAREQLYDAEKQEEIQRRLTGRPTPLLYYHPPFDALLFLPLAYLSYPTAYAVWVIVNLLVLLAVVHLLLPYLQALSLPLVVLFWLSVVFPVFLALFQGQMSILLLLVYVATFLALKRNAEFSAGGVLALGLFKFQFVIPLLPVFVVRRWWRGLAGFFCVALVLAFLSVAVVGVGGVLDYALLLWHLPKEAGTEIAADPFGVRAARMPNVRGFVTEAMSGSMLLGDFAPAAVLLVSVALLAWSLRYWFLERGRGEVFDLQFSLQCVVTLLVSYHAHLNDLALLTLPVLLLLVHLRTLNGYARPGFARSVQALLLFLVPAYVILAHAGRQNLLFWFLLALALLIGAGISCLSRGPVGAGNKSDAA